MGITSISGDGTKHEDPRKFIFVATIFIKNGEVLTAFRNGIERNNQNMLAGESLKQHTNNARERK